MTAAPDYRPIPFDQINTELLNDYESRLNDWLSAGTVRGREYVVGNLQNDPGDSLSINLDSGKWSDFAAIGGCSGPDPISLYAALYYDGDRVAAALDLGGQLGLIDNVVVPLRRSPPPAPKANVMKKPAEDWRPTVPPPDDAPDPDLRGWDHIHPHHDATGKLLRYVVRRDARDGKPKTTLPLTFGSLDGVVGWHYKHAGAPRCLYGLDRLAATPSALVVVVQGELKCDLLQRLLTDRVIVSATGGDKAAISKADWSPLAGRRVVVWPDNDRPGIGSAERVAEILLNLGCTVWVVDLSNSGQPDGWDAGNAVKSGWTADEITTWLKNRLVAKRVLS
jgi:putative DNA primase/helicase